MTKIDSNGNIINDIGCGLGINQDGHVTMDIGNNFNIDTTNGNIGFNISGNNNNSIWDDEN